MLIVTTSHHHHIFIFCSVLYWILSYLHHHPSATVKVQSALPTCTSTFCRRKWPFINNFYYLETDIDHCIQMTRSNMPFTLWPANLYTWHSTELSVIFPHFHFIKHFSRQSDTIRDFTCLFIFPPISPPLFYSIQQQKTLFYFCPFLNIVPVHAK